jgi:SAM-dependent methyltransferase
MGLFGSKTSGAGARTDGRTQRHSSGWIELAKHLKSEESLRILDIGPTSASNINFVTNLGHSIYMANLVEEAMKPEWMLQPGPGEDGPVYDVKRFLQQNLDFSGRHFDVVTLWDTIDYLPEPFVQPIVDGIYEVMQPGGRLLAFFHSKPTGDETVFARYHLTDQDQIDLQRIGGHTITRTHTNRQVETIFSKFAAFRFFLAKDALREVLVTR